MVMNFPNLDEKNRYLRPNLLASLHLRPQEQHVAKIPTRQRLAYKKGASGQHYSTDHYAGWGQVCEETQTPE